MEHSLNKQSFIKELIVLDNRPLNEQTFLLKVSDKSLALLSKAGQFFKLRSWPAPENGGFPLLDRPLSLHYSDGENLFFLYRVVGKGTELLSKLKKGDVVKLSGPLGKGLPDNCPELKSREIYMVAGGIGLAPMRAVTLWQDNNLNSQILYGERNKDNQINKEYLNSWGTLVEAAVEDGLGYGVKTNVVSLLEEKLKQQLKPIFTCGPLPMMKAIVEMAKKYDVPVWVSMETRMACGYGVCLSCSLPLLSGKRFNVCSDGPVYNGRLIDWENI